MKIEKGVKVLITGAGSGIGRSTAVAVAGLGATMFLTDVNAQGLAETAEIIKGQGGEVAASRAFDIADYEACKSFAADVHREHGPLDILMNIAGIAIWGQVEDLKHEHWQKAINVDLWGPIHVIECFLPAVIKAGRGGHLVNVASVAGLTGAPWHAPYSAAKWGLVGVSEVLRYDMMQHHIGVTVVCPGAVETPLKHTVQIIGVDPDSRYVRGMKAGFSAHAIPPEKVAQQIIRAVNRNTFLVLTSFDIKLVYFLKRHFFPLYHYTMIRISRMLNKAKE
ncbi:MAG TPA: SDR family oxidoreductase [bacterium]|nr:SDR family oxidoreductase [bacterium]